MHSRLCEDGRQPFLTALAYVSMIIFYLATNSQATLTNNIPEEEHGSMVSRATLLFTSENFVRLAYHASTVAGKTLVINGGDINRKNSSNETNHEIMNYTLTVDLSESWTSENVTINALTRDAAPNRNSGLLWANSDDSVYSFGGSRSLILNESISTHGGIELWKFTGLNWSQVFDSPSANSPTLTHISPAWAASAWAHGVGYALGGFVGDIRHSSNGNLVVPTTGLLSYNSTSNVWSNDSTVPAVTPYGLMGGQMLFASGFGAEGVLIALGGQFTGPGNWTNTRENFVPFSNISVYDIASKSWFWQAATGSTGPADIPPSRTFFCAAGIHSNQGTYEIFVYGGFDDSFISGTQNPSPSDNSDQATFNVAYVLSLPAFVWFKVNDTNADPRTQHTCNVAGNRQIISVGGINPTMPYPDYLNETDPWPQGLGIFDMTDLKWTNNYDAAAPAYTLPSVMQDRYNQPNSNSSIQWTNADVRSLFLSSSAASTVSPTPDPATTASPPAHGLSAPGLPAGVVAGIIIGVIAFVASVVVFAFLFQRQRRSAGRKKVRPSELEVSAMKHELESRAGTQELPLEPHKLRWGELDGRPVHELSSTSR